MNTLRSRQIVGGLTVLLLCGPVLSADDRYQRPTGGFGRVEGRLDRADLDLAAGYGSGYRTARTTPDDGVGLRPYERQPSAPTPSPPPPPRRTTAQYFPGMRSGQYTQHAPTFGGHHCTPSRGMLMGSR